MKRKRRGLIVVLALVSLLALAGVAWTDTICIYPESGCNVCYFYDANGNYHGFIKWRCG